MAFDPNTIIHTPNNWLETRLRYEGQARAEFADPPGAVEGPATVSFNSRGEGRVAIEVERIDSPDPAAFSLHSPQSPREYRVDGGCNPCISLTVQTEAGVFTAGNRILQAGGVLKQHGLERLYLHPIHSRFEAAGGGEAASWVLPLSNFILDHWPWPRVYPEFADHPLRVYPTPAIPVGLSGDELQAATMCANAHNGLLTFRIDDRPGFIERLPDYERRVRRLRRERRRRLITAVMVGSSHVQSVDFAFADNAGLFPLDIMSLLTLATGVPVGAPWIEFRDAKGALVRRVHISFGSPPYSRGHAALSDFGQNNIGYFLTRAFASAERGKKYLRVATNHALSAAKIGSLESRFIGICRGFETLCRHHGLRAHDLSALLDGGQRAAVQTALRIAAKQIREQGRAEANPERKRALEQITERVTSAAQKEKDFGLAVLDLARHFGFPDPDIIQNHLAAHPHPAGDNWPGILSRYRGAAIHEACFEIATRPDLWDIMRVMDHLHDLLLRIILKLLGYDGPYQPPIPPLAPRDSVDWVTRATHARALGYA